MDNENTTWQPVEPTTPVQKHPYERTAHMPNPYEDAIPIPPPPPPKRRGLLWWVITISLMIMLIPASAGLVYWAYTYHVDAWVQSLVTGKTVLVSPVPDTAAPTQQATQTPPQATKAVVDQHYTATDIVADFANAGAPIEHELYGATIWSYSEYNYFVSVHAASSAVWIDQSTQYGSVGHAEVGLWVYNSTSEAQSAFNQVGRDETQTTANIPECCIPTEYLHGRCLVLVGLGDGSGYAWPYYQQAIDKYCI